MNELKHFLAHLFLTISDHGNELISKLIHKAGLLSIGTGLTLGAVNDTASKVIHQTPDPWGLPDYAAIVSIVAGTTAILKHLVDVYFKVLEERRKNKD